MRAYQLDPGDSDVYETMGMALTKNNRHEEAVEWYKRGIAIDPTAANCFASLGDHGLLSGNAEQTLEAVTTAIQLNPFPPEWYFDHLGRAQLMLGDYGNAIITLSRPELTNISAFHLAAALAAAGYQMQAKLTATKFMSLHPHWRIEKWIADEFFLNDAAADFWRQALRQAGLPS